MSWFCCCRSKVAEDLPPDFLIVSPEPEGKKKSKLQDIKVNGAARTALEGAGAMYVGSYNTSGGYPRAVDGDLEILYLGE